MSKRQPDPRGAAARLKKLSRLRPTLALVLGSGVATETYADQGSMKWEGMFNAGGEAKAGHKPEEVEQAIYDNIAQLQKEEVPAEHLAFYAERDGAWQLDAEGAADKSKLDEFRQNNVALLKQGIQQAMEFSQLCQRLRVAAQELEHVPVVVERLEPPDESGRTMRVTQDLQFGFPARAVPGYVWCYTRNQAIPGALCATRKSADGYVIEGAIPLKYFSGAKVKPGQPFLVDGGINAIAMIPAPIFCRQFLIGNRCRQMEDLA